MNGDGAVNRVETTYTAPKYFTDDDASGEHGEYKHVSFSSAWSEHRQAWKERRRIVRTVESKQADGLRRPRPFHSEINSKKAEDNTKIESIKDLLNSFRSAMGELGLDYERSRDGPVEIEPVDRQVSSSTKRKDSGEVNICNETLNTLDKLGELVEDFRAEAGADSGDNGGDDGGRSGNGAEKVEDDTFSHQGGLTKSQKKRMKRKQKKALQVQMQAKASDANIHPRREEEVRSNASDPSIRKEPATSTTAAASASKGDARSSPQVNLERWIDRRRRWHALSQRFKTWRDAARAALDPAPSSDLGSKGRLQRQDTPEIDLLKLQFESLLRDKRELKEENVHLARQNDNLQELVNFISISAANSPAVPWETAMGGGGSPCVSPLKGGSPCASPRRSGSPCGLPSLMVLGVSPPHSPTHSGRNLARDEVATGSNALHHGALPSPRPTSPGILSTPTPSHQGHRSAFASPPSVYHTPMAANGTPGGFGGATSGGAKARPLPVVGARGSLARRSLAFGKDEARAWGEDADEPRVPNLARSFYQKGSKQPSA